MALVPEMEIDSYVGAWNFRVKIDEITGDVNPMTAELRTI